MKYYTSFKQLVNHFIYGEKDLAFLEDNDKVFMFDNLEDVMNHYNVFNDIDKILKGILDSKEYRSVDLAPLLDFTKIKYYYIDAQCVNEGMEDYCNSFIITDDLEYSLNEAFNFHYKISGEMFKASYMKKLCKDDVFRDLIDYYIESGTLKVFVNPYGIENEENVEYFALKNYEYPNTDFDSLFKFRKLRAVKGIRVSMEEYGKIIF